MGKVLVYNIELAKRLGIKNVKHLEAKAEYVGTTVLHRIINGDDETALLLLENAMKEYVESDKFSPIYEKKVLEGLYLMLRIGTILGIYMTLKDTEAMKDYLSFHLTLRDLLNDDLYSKALEQIVTKMLVKVNELINKKLF